MSNYDQPVSNQEIAQSLQNLDAPSEVIAEIVNQLPATGTSQVSVFTAPPTADQIGGNAVVVIETTGGSGPVVLDLSSLTPTQQNELVALIFSGNAGVDLVSITEGSGSNSSAPRGAATPQAAVVGGGLAGTIVLGSGNNRVNITSANDVVISAPDATSAGNLNAPGQVGGTWNNVFTFGGNGNTDITVGSGRTYIETGTGDNFVVFNGNRNSLDSLVGSTGNDHVTFGNKFQGTGHVDGGSGDDTLTVTAPIFSTNALANGVYQFTLANGSKINFEDIENFVLTQTGGSPANLNVVNLSALTTDVSITALDASYQLFLGNGNDSVVLGVGNDSVVTGAGNDSVSLAGGNDSVVLAGGDDLAILDEAFSGNALINGGGGVNTLDLSQVLVQSVVSRPDGSVLITLTDGSTVDASNIQNFIYPTGSASSAQSVGADGQDVSVIGVSELLNIFGEL